MALSLIIPSIRGLLDKPPLIDRIELDMSENEEVTYTARLANHPVELNRGTITDHVIKEPVIFTISGSVTDAPIISSFVKQAFGIAQQALGGPQQRTNHLAGRMKTARSGLVDLWKNPRQITIFTRRAAFSNMILTSLVIPNTGDTGEKFDFSATFQEVRLIETTSRLLTAQEKEDIGEAQAAAIKRQIKLSKEEEENTGKGISQLYKVLPDTFKPKGG